MKTLGYISFGEVRLWFGSYLLTFDSKTNLQTFASSEFLSHNWLVSTRKPQPVRPQSSN